ncbi:hypothetical protein HK405_010165, partial [Cladochytrium tenue]
MRDEEEALEPTLPYDGNDGSSPWSLTRLVHTLRNFYLLPEGAFLQLWDQVMVFLTVVNCLLVPLMPAFLVLDPLAFAVCYVVEAAYLADLFLRFHVAYLSSGFWVIFPSEMAANYVRTAQFRFDLLCNLPVDLIALGWVGSDKALYVLVLVRVFKMMRFARMVAFFRRQEMKLHASFLLQVVKFTSLLITLTHSLACIWFAMACPTADAQSCRNPSWVYQSNLNLIDEDPVAFLVDKPTLYVYAIYYTVTTTTTTGYGDVRPQNNAGKVFSIFVMSAGVFFYGYISGTIASVLSNMDSRRVSYQQKMDAVRQYMADRAMDSDMQERVLCYYDYLWERNKGIDVKNLFEDMPSAFRSEMALSLNSEIIDKANIFRGCSVGFRRIIAIFMKLYLFTADEYVVHKGDIGEEMYFVTQGRIDIYATEDMRRPTASLIEGAHFGEFQIVLKHRHEYSAKAVCNTDIYVLRKDELDVAFDYYPEDRVLVMQATEERYQQALKTRRSRTVKTHQLPDDDALSSAVQSRNGSFSLTIPGEAGGGGGGKGSRIGSGPTSNESLYRPGSPMLQVPTAGGPSAPATIGIPRQASATLYPGSDERRRSGLPAGDVLRHSAASSRPGGSGLAAMLGAGPATGEEKSMGQEGGVGGGNTAMTAASRVLSSPMINVRRPSLPVLPVMMPSGKSVSAAAAQEALEEAAELGLDGSVLAPSEGVGALVPEGFGTFGRRKSTVPHTGAEQVQPHMSPPQQHQRGRRGSHFGGWQKRGSLSVVATGPPTSEVGRVNGVLSDQVLKESEESM